jgi:tryptophan-rich sensory protein
MQLLDIARGLAPIVLGFGAGMLCRRNLTDTGADIPARPPAFVFGIAWTVLYILLGVAWILAVRVNPVYDAAFITLVLLLTFWIYMYGCRAHARAALYIILLSIMVTLFIVIGLTADETKIGMYLLPLLTWLLFACMLNYTIANAET